MRSAFVNLLNEKRKQFGKNELKYVKLSGFTYRTCHVKTTSNKKKSIILCGLSSSANPNDPPKKRRR
ncbi:hypothetical protein PS2_039501 [Malus domestica]